jgi:hypothetical protein
VTVAAWGNTEQVVLALGGGLFRGGSGSLAAFQCRGYDRPLTQMYCIYEAGRRVPGGKQVAAGTQVTGTGGAQVQVQAQVQVAGVSAGRGGHRR